MKNFIPLFKVFMPSAVDKEILKTLHSGYIAEGKIVNKFTEKVAKFIGNRYVVPVSSCTMALTIAYELAGIKEGDEVITTPLTCIATNVPLLKLRVKIIWADCDPDTGMIDPYKLEALITNKTKAIVVLHKDGDLAEIDKIIRIAKKYKLKVIEDAAHVFGAKYRGKMIGNFGDYTCFSFQAIKHLTTGDGGIIACKKESDYKKARRLKWFGIDKEEARKYKKNIWMNDVIMVGYKGNMNDISATIGLVQMKYIKKIIKKCHENGKLYDKLLKGIDGISLIKRNPRHYPVYWVYTLLVERNRDKLINILRKNNIDSGIIHPRNDIYSIFRRFKRPLPGVDHYSTRELSLPCGWWVNKKDIERIAKIIKENI